MTKSEEKRDVADIKCLRMGRDRHGIAKMRNERWPNTAPNGVKKKSYFDDFPDCFFPLLFRQILCFYAWERVFFSEKRRYIRKIM